MLRCERNRTMKAKDIILIAADNIESLRKTDVFRLFNEFPGDWKALFQYISKNRPDLTDECTECMADLKKTGRMKETRRELRYIGLICSFDGCGKVCSMDAGLAVGICHNGFPDNTPGEMCGHLRPQRCDEA